VKYTDVKEGGEQEYGEKERERVVEEYDWREIDMVNEGRSRRDRGDGLGEMGVGGGGGSVRRSIKFW
jgi:hypothetical protein